MKIILSRKGFDSSAGGGPSPVVDGVPISLPIPANGGPSRTTYGDLGLADHAAKASRGRVGAADKCHHDPMAISAGEVILGQCGAAQTHLERQGVGEGDLFVFFGLFRGEDGESHHRIFGYLQIGAIVDLEYADAGAIRELADLGCPHALGMHAKNDAVYRGRGAFAQTAPDALRLTVPGGPPSLWQVPTWLKPASLSYHGKEGRWLPGNRLQSVARGQEFVTDVGRKQAPRAWAERMIALIEG